MFFFHPQQKSKTSVDPRVGESLDDVDGFQVSSTQRARILTYPGRWLVDVAGQIITTYSRRVVTLNGGLGSGNPPKIPLIQV